MFSKKGLPVEIIAEFEQWRRIRDSEGEEGWVYQSMLAGERTAMVAPWKKEPCIPLHAAAPSRSPPAVALARHRRHRRYSSSAAAMVRDCRLSGYNGWVEQAMLFGVYPGEQIGN